MPREPEELAALRSTLGKQLAACRMAAEVTQRQLAKATNRDRSNISHIERGEARGNERFWRIADECCNAKGVLLAAYRQLETVKREHEVRTHEVQLAKARAKVDELSAQGGTHTAFTLSQPSINTNGILPPVLASPPLCDQRRPLVTDDAVALRQTVQELVALDNRYGGDELSRFATRVFRGVERRLASGMVQPDAERDVQAAAGELAEIAGWLAFDANNQQLARAMNHEALLLCRMAGDRSMELLVIQNMCMQAGYLNRPREALGLARSVLERDTLSPRLHALFRMREARALTQGGNARDGMRAMQHARALFDDGMQESDPAWAWWVDERQFSWHEGMAYAEVGQPDRRVALFYKSMDVTPADQIRWHYMNHGYLLEALVAVGDWPQASHIISEVVPYVTEVGSVHTMQVLHKAINAIRHAQPQGEVREAAEYLAMVLRGGKAPSAE